MLQIVIFSFNRALQLDTLITSLKEQWKQPAYQLDVLYNSSSDAFQQGYEQLIEKHESAIIRFHKEGKDKRTYSLREWGNPVNFVHLLRFPMLRHPCSNFRPLLIKLIEENPLREVMFMTDDAMYIRPVNIPQEQLDWVNERPFERQYVLRMGLGMNEQPENIIDCGDFLEWNTYDVPQDNNWGYHFSVDAHIYSKQLILRLFKDYVFTSPNSLEGYICKQVRRHHWLKNARSPRFGTLLSYPINMVQTFSDNETLGISIEMMNDYYLQGYTMKYPVPEVIDVFQQYPNHITLYKDRDEKILILK